MCNDHGKVFGKDSVILLTEARLDVAICDKRIGYLEIQVKSFMQYLREQGADAKAVVLGIHHSTLRTLEEHTMEEFIWNTMREDSDSLSDITSGMDDVAFRLEDEQQQHGAYWGMLHNIASQAYKKEYATFGEEIFNKAQEFCDKLEEHFNTENKYPLTYDQYQLGWKGKKRIDLQRFKLKNISYEQWAYITNRLNTLLSIDKQFGCDAQNIEGQQYSTEENLEDVAYEVEQVYYTMS